MDNGKSFTRRDFIKLSGAGATLLLAGKFGIHSLAWADSKKKTLKMVLVDYTKCTGCRTCEAVCSAYHNPVIVNGKSLPGLGNPVYSRIRVHSFNPDVDIPNVCNMCPDAPCVKACPVEPEPKTGRRAIYRDEKTQTIQNDPKRCIACGSCAKACAEQRTGVIELDPQTGKPRPTCNLCGGEPQCVKQCPFNALSVVEVKPSRKFYGKSPKKIATELSKKWYGVSDIGGVK
ncbi:twin-arginine translocation signal domain-containing protein [Thermodesulfovibrio yellowstonii]|uniref:(Fe-S)-binding protein n=1 Tax=Thermodesulfovibrio yellowstonii TaxID=28262 RepID=A0A9W6GFG9_9BACT|nr:twin-arginine translocation signal domain-containing protein [Thermodesulfovibrio islandicus]GLI52933.1 (Fe-S)-binding protein [Thermodesulfovibrio islandicus]